MIRKVVRRGLNLGLAILLAAVAAPSARAQGMFYQEVQKDGRIYVFALAPEYESWSKSGEMGKATTRLSYGPNGETVVFDSEDAINYYNFKHDKPGEVFKKPVAAPKPADNFSIKLGTTIFTDFTYTDAPKIQDADKNSVNKSEFEVRRAYINVTGTINDYIAFRVTPDVTARQSTAASGLPTGATVSSSLDGSLTIRLKYAYGQFNLDKVVSHGSWIRIGQQQTPYVDYYENIYRYRFQGTIFPEREGFLSSSDVGLSARLAFPNDYGDVHLGFYNGDTYSKAEANGQKAFQARATLRPAPKSQDFKGFRVALFYDHDSPVKGGSRDRLVVAPSFEHKYVNAGFEYLDAKDRTSGVPGKAEVKASGWSLFVTPRTTIGLEGLFRYDSLKPNKSVDATKTRTLIGAAYWFKMQKAPLAAAVLADYEQVKYDTLLAKPEEKRLELKLLFNF